VTDLRPATVRFYFDADVLGVAKVVAALRYDVTYPGDSGATINKRVRPPCPIQDRSTKDHVWIPEVARRHWLIITRDRHIQDHPAEIAAVRDHDAKMVALSAADAGSTWNQLEVVMINWRRFEALASELGPRIWRATRSGIGAVKLE